MSRTLIAWLPVGVLILSAGCSICASPYDECGPTLGALSGDSCQPGSRAGSILGGPYGSAYPDAMIESGPVMEGEVPEGELIPTPASPSAELLPAPAAPVQGDVSKFFPGVPRESILSVTDRKVEDGGLQTQAATDPHVESEPQVEPEPRPTRVPARSASSGGWNARRVNLRRPG